MKVNNSTLHNKVNAMQEGVFHFNYFYQCIIYLTYSDFTIIFQEWPCLTRWEMWCLVLIYCSPQPLHSELLHSEYTHFPVSFSPCTHLPLKRHAYHIYRNHDSDFCLTQFSFTYMPSIRTFASHLNIVINIFLVTIIYNVIVM